MNISELEPTIDKFRLKVRALKPGERLQYHAGFLFEDRMYDPFTNKMGTAAWQLYLAGVVELVQRRNGKGCEYLVVRKAHDKKRT